MKKTQKILGLPIISISDGMEAGRVKSIIINADRGAIDYIVVDSGIQIFSARVIPTNDVAGIGEYALTIENEGVITDISRIPEAIQLLQNDIRVKGTKVLTRKGSLIGEIGDIYVDENDGCKITGLEFIADITQKKVRLIPRDSVITFGKNLTVVKEDIESSLLDTPDQLDSDAGTADMEKKNNAVIEDSGNVFADTFNTSYEPQGTAFDISSAADTADDAVIADAADINEVPAQADNTDEQNDSTQDNASVLFEQRQRQYLKGRYATRTIMDSLGNVIIGEGMQIDDAVIDEAKAKDKLVELVMNNRA
ncbi:MAG: hypothetical protein GX279_01490 [Clostridiaceae bacterium]|nr:hypothetical protein [Clostridiaceae bacterium]